MPSPPEPNDINAWHKWFGIECNNLAWTLSEKPLRSAAEDTELLALAHSSAFHWGKVGTELNKTRGHMLLGQAYAVTGIGSLAMKYSQLAYDYVMSHESPDWEIAFAHAVLANAAYSDGQLDLYREQYELAKSCGEALPGEEDRIIFNSTFVNVPVITTTS